MSKAWKKILLSQEILVNSPELELNRLISSLDQKAFKVKALNIGKYKFLSNMSVGTAIVSGGGIEGIKVFGEVKKVSDTTSALKITSKLRIELVFICIFWLGAILFQIFGSQSLPLWINLALFPGLLIWFGIVFRVQEMMLMNKVVIEITETLEQEFNH